MDTHAYRLTESVNGRAEPTTAGLAVLLGLSRDELTERCRGRSSLPEDLMRLAKRRAREGQAATGSTASGPVLMHWARERFGGDVEFDHFESTPHVLWMILPADVEV